MVSRSDSLKKIEYIDLSSREYPLLLKEIQDPPKGLYFLGDISILSRLSISVVGARKCTEYGKWVGFNTGKTLGANGVVVVSGMAYGVDAYAHEGALAVGGKTVAVLGCGVDICYPKSNWNLKKRIEENGLIISEYPPGAQPKPYAFPMRNRIISGISKGTVVVEAGINSGSLITAEKAAEQGRMVYAVPGNINRELSIGCNKLIQDGATPVVVINDVMWNLGLNELKTSKQNMETLKDDERIIYKTIDDNGEVTIDDIYRITDVKLQNIQVAVTSLEMKGLVQTALGKVFIPK